MKITETARLSAVVMGSSDSLGNSDLVYGIM